MEITGERIGVIGSGVAGLTAAYLLQRKYEVLLFEADDRLGGHAHTHDVPSTHGGTVGVDSGFIVHNERTYPTLLKLFGELGVHTRDTEMSMSIRCDGCGLQYAGAKGLPGLFAQRGNALRGRYLRMLAEVKRFHRHAKRLLAAPDAGDVTLGAFLAIGGYSRYFVDHFMLPLVSTVWSADRADTLRYPARYLFEFLRNHGMLTVKNSPAWRTVVGGSREYVELAAKQLTAVHLSTPVRSVLRTGSGVEIRDDADTPHRVDKVVVATHADQALALLAHPTAAERSVLGAFRYSENEAWLHTDTSVLPTRPDARAGWNYRAPVCGAPTGAVQVSYDMNRLMRLDEPTGYVVTLNPGDGPGEDHVVARMRYEHPVYTPESVAAQRRLPELNDGVLAYAGAYHGWGFHEDGCSSGARAAESLGVSW
ncbi:MULTISPECIES: FAD-dependent oxidoreductase [unclassified Amycolatopsis]|uniref:NAD(P)/FAD-dependent oxidoreductase n=1 Tax=unclassified Amycolatopsis TaxID=2618356 RepID=UPI0028768F7D|nr:MULTISPECIES: FAD-dependent oxidoreductase [unclassified Amycolatopsis]MDS0140524.1 FAD-dependent oxidoreductase [Amycolatopsis sp. 505]MDS0148624.1 FAD-dependent oxidoreductase [Amycolatopsis sp. CM201R]